MTDAPAILAAGAVCWRIVGGKVRILLVQRNQRNDISLPKGKVDPGELLPQTAVREIAEETGLSVGLGAPLGEVRYTIPSGRSKIVYYWSAEVDGHSLETARFRPNEEISALEWVSISKARNRLTYPHDVDIVNAFAERWKAGRARTFAVIVVRHGKAVPADAWDGPDATRPLLLGGAAQAAAIAPAVAAFRPERILTSTVRSNHCSPCGSHRPQAERTRGAQPGCLRKRRGHNRRGPGQADEVRQVGRALQPRSGHPRDHSRTGPADRYTPHDRCGFARRALHR